MIAVTSGYQTRIEVMSNYVLQLTVRLVTALA
jgi:hypothetical protein